ncbi:DUF2189 domain-containing protein [Roseovarius albus]|uniref:DUF2189 domain-containing protein n=1 Tax=Roseovarius albus TaxID=1247867 RepID=UPI001F2C4EE2|nr:DUF2189 domain-containing protein [Roseovarius albus]
MDAVFGASRAAGEAVGALGTEITEVPKTNPIDSADIRKALRMGLDDFKSMRSDVIFLVLIYPIIGATLVVMAFNKTLLPLIAPLAAGFALLGPVAAIGLYEMSRQRETNKEIRWHAALSALSARNLGPVLVLGFYLLCLFLAWMCCAYLIYILTLGPEPPASAGTFLLDVTTTQAGWAMVIVGLGVGFLFACLVLVISLISFPMLIDQHVGVSIAVATSIKVAKQSPATVLQWGFIVAALMAIGTLPFFLGLVVVLPILGHATWHLYRAAVPMKGG